MDTLSVWTFGAPDGAELALRQVERLQLRRAIAVADAAVVAWPAGATRPRTYQVGSVQGTVALSGAFWGLVFGLAVHALLQRRRAHIPVPAAQASK